MSTKRFKHLHKEDAVWDLGFMFLDREQMLIYNEDPDLYMAKTFGFDTTKDYFEFEDNYGVALCGGMTKRGKPCEAVIACTADHAEWRCLHRKALCNQHKGQQARRRQPKIIPLMKA
jgi:hypothetical protein